MDVPASALLPQSPLSKADWRQLMKSLLRQNLATREAASAALRTKLVTHPAWGQARTIGLFASLPSEPNLFPLLEHGDKSFVFPVVHGVDLLWRRVRSEKELQPGPPPLRLREPTEGPEIDLHSIDLLLVPGLAFTRDGARLGRGGGFYDRVLARRETPMPSEPRARPLPLAPPRMPPLTLGVCFPFQVVDSLPTESHDQPVDALLDA